MIKVILIALVSAALTIGAIAIATAGSYKNYRYVYVNSNYVTFTETYSECQAVRNKLQRGHCEKNYKDRYGDTYGYSTPVVGAERSTYAKKHSIPRYKQPYVRR